MNLPRKLRSLVAMGSVSIVAMAALVTSAEAGKPFSNTPCDPYASPTCAPYSSTYCTNAYTNCVPYTNACRGTTANVYYGCRPVFGNTLHYYPTTSLCNTPLCNTAFSNANCRTTGYVSAYPCSAPGGYPVTLYDQSGRPYVVSQASNISLVR